MAKDIRVLDLWVREVCELATEWRALKEMDFGKLVGGFARGQFFENSGVAVVM